jgi:DNA-binding beta-propeller fold protein YncE
VTTGSGVTPIDLATNTLGTPIPFPVGTQLVAIAITPDGKTGYVANALIGNFSVNDIFGYVTPLDLATNTLGTPIPFPPGTAATAIAITPDGKTAYVADAAYFVGTLGAIVPIDLASNTPGALIPLPPNTRPVAIVTSHDGKTAYVAANCGGCVNVVVPIDLATNSPGTPIPFGAAADEFNSIVIAPDDKTAYVTVSSGGGGYIVLIDLMTDTPTAPIPTGAYPWAIALAPDGKTAYVVNRQAAVGFDTMASAVNAVVPIDLATKTLGAPIVAGAYPRAIVITL